MNTKNLKTTSIDEKICCLEEMKTQIVHELSILSHYSHAVSKIVEETNINNLNEVAEMQEAVEGLKLVPLQISKHFEQLEEMIQKVNG